MRRRSKYATYKKNFCWPTLISLRNCNFFSDAAAIIKVTVNECVTEFVFKKIWLQGLRRGYKLTGSKFFHNPWLLRSQFFLGKYWRVREPISKIWRVWWNPSFFTTSGYFTLSSFWAKIDKFENPSLKFDGFVGTPRTHTNGAPGLEKHWFILQTSFFFCHKRFDTIFTSTYVGDRVAVILATYNAKLMIDNITRFTSNSVSNASHFHCNLW